MEARMASIEVDAKEIAELREMFEKMPARPGSTRYDLVIENGEPRWIARETDLLVEALMTEMFGDDAEVELNSFSA